MKIDISCEITLSSGNMRFQLATTCSSRKHNFSDTTGCSELKTRDLARNRIIEQNLTRNVDLDFIAPNRLKMMFSATTGCSELKTKTVLSS